MDEQVEGAGRQRGMHSPDVCVLDGAHLPPQLFGDTPLSGSQSMGGSRVGLLSSSGEGKHIIKAGPILVLNYLGPRIDSGMYMYDPLRFYEIRLNICWELRKAILLLFQKKDVR